MNLNMIRPKNETEDLLLSITKNCETPIEQTHRKPEETLEFKMIHPKQIFHFTPPVQIKGDWMIGLRSLELYNSIFIITKENNKFELYRETDKFGFLELKDELEGILNISHISQEHLDDEIIGPRIIDDLLKLSHEKKYSDGCSILLMGYVRSPFRDFEIYLRIKVGLDEEGIQLILKQYNSYFITYELRPGIYTIQDISHAVGTFSGHEGRLQIEYDNINMKTKINLTRAGESFMSLRFEKKSFFNTLLGFEPYWDYKPIYSNHPRNPTAYIGNKTLNLSTTNKIHLKCDIIDGSVVNGLRQPILYSFVLDKLPGYKVFCEPETIHYKKRNKSILNTIPFYLEDDNNEGVDFNQETLTFTLHIIKI